LHGIIFVLAYLFALIAVGTKIYTLQTSTFSSPEDLQWEWVHFRNILLSGGFALVIWLVVLSVHAMFVRTVQNEDDELERVMEREYKRIESERESHYDYSHLTEQYDEANIEPDRMSVKRNSRTNHHLE
jgi:hypothetical protein